MMTGDDLVEMEQVKRVKYRYLRAMDTGDFELLGTLFTEDVTARFVGGSYDVTVEGRAKLLEYLAASANADVVINHNCHHPEIDLTGPATAEGLWYLQDWYYNRVQKRTVRGAAFYRDRYAKQGGKWKISHTGYERVWEVVEDNVPPITFTANVLGQRGRRV
jgi:SnoaL-like domain